MLQNGSFEEGWTDLPPAAGSLINQQPNGWNLRWIEPGDSLFGVSDTAGGVPECVHKLANQLPPNEQLGAPNALILDGTTTYKIFNSGAAFGAELTQVVDGLKPGSDGKLVVPVLAVLYNETDPFGAESGVWVNGEGRWVNGGEMGNREWFHHEVDFTVPDSGSIEIAIRVKSKWPRPKDFFIDNVQLEVESGRPDPDDDHPGGGDPAPGGGGPGAGTAQADVRITSDLAVITAVSADTDKVIVIVPEGKSVSVD